MIKNIPIRIGDLFTQKNISYLIVDVSIREEGGEFIRLLSPEGKTFWIPNVFGYFVPTQQEE